MFKVSRSSSASLYASSETRWLRLTSAEVPHDEERRVNSALEREGEGRGDEGEEAGI